MTAGIFLLVAVCISFVVIRFGAVALEITGISWESAKFQSLSAFTNSGFTTFESEKITSHPIRRKIVSVLIILGNAGFVAVVGSFAGSILQEHDSWFFINFIAIFLGLAFFGWVARRPTVSSWLHKFAKNWLGRKFSLVDLPAEDLLHIGQGYRLSHFEIKEDSPVIGFALNQLRLKQHSVQILRIDRKEGSIPIPRGKSILQARDQLVVYGKTESIQKLFETKLLMDLIVVDEIEQSVEKE